MNPRALEGRAAVVTGGGRGIGLAVAQRLLAAGARVALWDTDSAALTAALKEFGDGGGVVTATVDITDPFAVNAARDGAATAFGGIDIIVNSAGIAGPTVPSLDYGLDDWRRVIDVNLTGTFLVCKQVAPLLVARGWGRIVNIASLAGKEGTPNAPAYSASKAAVIAFTKSLGKELATTGVLVNSVAPAALDTDMVRNMSAEHVRIMVSKSPLGRLGTAAECAALVAWLCSPECSFSTGAAFDLSGGRAVY